MDNAVRKTVEKVTRKRPWYRTSPWRVIRTVIGGFLILQILTAVGLIIISSLRRRHKQGATFPHLPLDEIQVQDNCLQLYSYGQELFDAMLEAIDNAKESIYLETYIWKDDAVGQAFKKRLAQKAAEGIQVYVIFDDFGNLVVPRAFKVFPPYIHAMKYQIVRNLIEILDLRRYALDHRKLLIVDGQIGFIGGYNLGQLYATSWRDTHLRVAGPAAAYLAQSFVDFWNRYQVNNDRITHRYSRRFDPGIMLHENDALRLTFPIRDMYIEAIDRASHFILLTNAYFAPDHILLDSLKAAAQRGVDVRILVPAVSNHVLVDWISHGYFSECLDGGIRVFLYRYSMLHAKTCTIDGQWSTIGTANLDRLSSIGNFEINVEIYSNALARQMQVLFENDTAELHEVTPEIWSRRPWYTKLSERILAPWRFMM